MPTRVVLIETETAEETAAIGEAIERVMRARYGGNGEAVLLRREVAELGALPAGREEGNGGPDEPAAHAAPPDAAPPDAAPPDEFTSPAGEGEGGEAAGSQGTAKAKGEGAYVCDQLGCGRIFGRSQDLGRHKFLSHGIKGVSRAGKARLIAGRVQRDGLTPDAEGKVACKVCGRRVSPVGYGSHMAVHEREARDASPPAPLLKGEGSNDSTGPNIRRAPVVKRMGIPATPAARRLHEEHGFGRINTPPLLDDPRR